MKRLADKRPGNSSKVKKRKKEADAVVDDQAVASDTKAEQEKKAQVLLDSELQKLLASVQRGTASCPTDAAAEAVKEIQQVVSAQPISAGSSKDAVAKSVAKILEEKVAQANAKSVVVPKKEGEIQGAEGLLNNRCVFSAPSGGHQGG